MRSINEGIRKNLCGELRGMVQEVAINQIILIIDYSRSLDLAVEVFYISLPLHHFNNLVQMLIGPVSVNHF